MPGTIHEAPAVALFVLFGLIVAPESGCSGDEGEGTSAYPCTPDQPSPYPDGIPYVGIHGGPGNSDIVGCVSAPSFTQSWHALKGLGVVQPNTFSPDGLTTYITTTHPDPGGCRVHALDVASGAVTWCLSYPADVARSAVEVDADGNLYMAAGDDLVSLTPAGSERWVTWLGDGAAPWGQHFTPDGHVAVVTTPGVVHLLDRVDGSSLASLDIPAMWGFVPSASLDLSIADVAPDEVVEDIEAVFGTESEEFVNAFFGAGGGYSSNTVAVSPRNELYVVGGGPDEETGALVQIGIGGSADNPTLTPGWYIALNGGSACTPSVTSDGHLVAVGDGAIPGAMLDPHSAEATIKVIDVDACDANEDSDDSDLVCAAWYSIDLERGPLAGSPALADDGTVYTWETTTNLAAFDAQAVDLRAVDADGPVWDVTLPDDMTWTSVVTVTEDHIIGTATQVVLSDVEVVGLYFPGTAESVAITLDRASGEIVWSDSVTDDASATVTVGRDGSLYVGLLGLLSILSVDQDPVLGLVKFEAGT